MSATVLLVDDDADTRRLFRIILETEGYRCVEAGDSVGARTAVDRGGIDLALIDVMLGAEDGLALTRSVLAFDPPVAVVLVSGVDDPDLAEAALHLGAYGYLVKPVRRSDLLDHVANALPTG